MTTQVKNQSDFVEYAEKNHADFIFHFNQHIGMSYLYPKYVLYTCIKCIGTDLSWKFTKAFKSNSMFRYERQTETNRYDYIRNIQVNHFVKVLMNART